MPTNDFGLTVPDLYYREVCNSKACENICLLCILKHVGDVGDRSSTPKGCNAIYVGDVRDRYNLQYT